MEQEWKELKTVFGYTSKEENRLQYKRCNDVIVQMTKLGDREIKTNENRKNVQNQYFAKFRADQLLVLKIYDLSTKKELTEYKHITSELPSVTYKVNEYVVPDRYDTNDDNVCTNGIHFFNSLERAYLYSIRCIWFRDDGRLWNDNEYDCQCTACNEERHIILELFHLR